jgi:hypothetical protein
MSLENTTYDEFWTIIERPSWKMEPTAYKPITVVSSENGGGGDSLVIQNNLDEKFDALFGTANEWTIKEKNSLIITPWINDDWPWKAQDNGKTFGFAWEYKTSDMIIWWKLDAYTKNTWFNEKTRMIQGTRIDHMEMYALKKVSEVRTNVGKIVGFAGAGIQGVGDFGGSGIQNWWHEKWPIALTADKSGKRYWHAQTYETWKDGKTISGWTPDLRFHAEWKTTPILWDEKYGVSLLWAIDAKIPIIHKYGETAITATAWVEAKLDRVKAELSATTHIYRDMPLSDVIRSAWNNPNNYMVAKMSVDVWRSWNTTISPYIAVERSLDKNSLDSNKMRGSIWVQINF